MAYAQQLLLNVIITVTPDHQTCELAHQHSTDKQQTLNKFSQLWVCSISVTTTVLHFMQQM